jgi:L-histidine Nalpha-methyltransferase
VKRYNIQSSGTALVRIHSSLFPRNIRRELLGSLRRRNINPRFHYQSVKQATKWLKLHRAWAPSQRDADCRATYNRAFTEAVRHVTSKRLHLVGLGCGHGQKEAELLRSLGKAEAARSFTPVDVSLPLVLQAREAARPFLGGNECAGLFCDLQKAPDLPRVISELQNSGAARLYSFFGVIPNFEQRGVFRLLASLVRPQDWLLFSANLAPGPDYQRGLEKVLPGYDNPLTRDWLLTFLLDLGLERTDGAVKFSIEDDHSGLKKIAADFHFAKRREIEVDDHPFTFSRDETIRLFFSYRYTPGLIRTRLQAHGLHLEDEWITKSGEEGIFFCRRAN